YSHTSANPPHPHSFPTRRSSDLKQRTSYAIGLDVVTSLKAREIDLDPKALAAGIADALADKPALKPEEVREVLMKFQQEMMAKGDRKSTRLNSSHLGISYAVFCL